MSASSSQNEWINDFQALLDDQFQNAHDVFTIEEETFFDSKVFQDIDVRINHIVNTETGEKVGDDYKNILFKEYQHPVYLGRYYKFDDNYWLTINVDKIKSLTTSASVKRCNNVLRWIDKRGGLHEIPCSLDMRILENRNYSTAGSSLVLPSGVVECITQLNNETNLILPNQRFLFGNKDNWTVLKVQGGGINNYNNINTSSNDSGGLLRLTLALDFVNEQTDNIELGIAEYYQYSFIVNILNGDISGNIGNTIQLNHTVKLDDKIIDAPVVWSSSNDLVANVSTTGKVSFISNGLAVIKCQVKDNSNYYDEIAVDVNTSQIVEDEILLSPNINYIYLGDDQEFDVRLILNSVVQSDTFTFTINPNTIPSLNYTFTQTTPNKFKIKNNKQFFNDFLVVTCLSSSGKSNQFEFYLKGGW